MKEFLRERDIPMLDFMPGDSDAEPSKIFQHLGKPVVVKPRQESGGRDLVFADTEAVLCRANKRNKILERYLNAPEFSVESFTNNHQIHFQSITQYYVKGHVNIVPALLSPEQQALLLDFNRKIIAAMNIQWGITHLELYLTEKTAYFGEIALRPPGGYLMELISASYGFNAWDAQVAMDLDLDFIFPAQRQAFSAACIFHPGKGVLRNVENWNHARNLSGVFRSRLKREIGDVVAHRDSVGEDVGYLLLKDANSESLLEQVDWVQNELRFELDTCGKME
jgi:biotin carboxylase